MVFKYRWVESLNKTVQIKDCEDLLRSCCFGCIRNLVSKTHLDGSILRGCDHDREDRVEYDTRDGRAVPTQGVSLWGTGDPLLGVPLLTDSSSVCHLLFRFIQL